MTDITFQGSIIIRRPVLEVFEYVANAKAIAEWYPFYTHVEILPEPREGCKLSFTAALAFRPYLDWGYSINVDLIDYVPGRRLSYRSYDFGTTVMVDFQPAMGGTLVTITQSLWGWQAIAFSWVAQPLRLLVNDLIMQSITSLKQKAEARRSNARPLIFFNYRRKQEYIAGRIYDALCQDFGADYLFKDLESILVGSRWRNKLDEALKQCSIVVAHIGDGWEKDLCDGLKDDVDYVREELRSVMEKRSDILIIPIFTTNDERFNMRDRLRIISKALPDELKDIRAAIEINQGLYLRTNDDFRHDLEKLLRAVWNEVESTELRFAAARAAEPSGTAN